MIAPDEPAVETPVITREPGAPDVQGDAYLTKSTIEALAAFRYLLRQFQRYSEDRSRNAGVTPQQYQLLLATHGQVGRDWASITELAEALQIQHHAAVGLVSRCERAELLSRTIDPHDRRLVRVRLTQKGLDVTNQIASRNFAELKDLLLSLELLFRRGEVNLVSAAAVIRSLSVDR